MADRCGAGQVDVGSGVDGSHGRRHCHLRVDTIGESRQLRDASDFGCQTLYPGQWGQQGQEHVDEKVVVLFNVDVSREASLKGVTNSRGFLTGLEGCLHGERMEALVVGG